MADSPRDPQQGPEKGCAEDKSKSGELGKTPSQAEETIASPHVKVVNTINFLLPPKVPGDMGSLGGFRIIKILGEGGMGLVFLAEDSSLNRKLAIKVILPTHANQTTKERFFREARATAALHHDNVIAIFQVGEDNGVPFLAMPFLQGMPLDKYLAEQKKLSVKEALRITVESLAGLSSAHSRNMVHRDIKPSNIWLEGARKKVILLDFGLAKGGGSEDTKLTRVGAIMGTPAYMSPEQAQAKTVDRRSDLFSVGVVLYEMLTGEGPFKGKTIMAILANLMSQQPKAPMEIDPSISKEVSDICMWMLEKDPEKRPRSAREVAVRIQGFEKGGDKEEKAEAVAKTEGAKTDSIEIKKTGEAPWNPRRNEEFNALYSSSQPNASQKIHKKKRKKSSLASIIISMVGIFLLLMGGLILSFQFRSRASNKEEKQLVKEEKKLPKNLVPEEGFIPLFPKDGVPEDWDNRSNGNLEADFLPNPWVVTHGILEAMPGPGCTLISKKDFSSLILKFDFKLDDDAHSAFIYCYDKNREKENRHLQIQILGKNVSDQRGIIGATGSIHGKIPAKTRITFNPEWNSFWLKIEGARVDCKINDQSVLGFDFSSPPGENNQPIPNSMNEFKENKNLPLRGRLGFNSWHTAGKPISFRNILIKELNPDTGPNKKQ